MQIEISDPAFMDSLRAHMQQEGVERTAGGEVVDVVILWS